MNYEKRMRLSVIVNIVWIVLGTILICFSFAEKVDMFWNGMGTSLLVIGVIQILRCYRLNKNEAYREMMKIEEKDERNRFIRNKAWAWTGYLFMMTAAISCIVLRIVGQELLCLVASGAVCFMLILYWIVYGVLKRKY